MTCSFAFIRLSSPAALTFKLLLRLSAGSNMLHFSHTIFATAQWHKLDPGVPHLVIYTAFFYFSTVRLCRKNTVPCIDDLYQHVLSSVMLLALTCG